MPALLILEISYERKKKTTHQEMGRELCCWKILFSLSALTDGPNRAPSYQCFHVGRELIAMAIRLDATKWTRAYAAIIRFFLSDLALVDAYSLDASAGRVEDEIVFVGMWATDILAIAGPYAAANPAMRQLAHFFYIFHVFSSKIKMG